MKFSKSIRSIVLMIGILIIVACCFGWNARKIGPAKKTLESDLEGSENIRL